MLEFDNALAPPTLQASLPPVPMSPTPLPPISIAPAPLPAAVSVPLVPLPPPLNPLPEFLKSPVRSPTPTHLSSTTPALVGIVEAIIQDLETHPSRLLSLNPSRREAIAQHLNWLAGLYPSPQGTSNKSEIRGGMRSERSLLESNDSKEGLRRWIEGHRTPAQNAALRTYFEEVAVVTLSQALLLKSWSDRGIKKWSESDLGRLNWALSTALKPHIPLDREGWQITRPNMYSWYNPVSHIQREIWTTFESWRLSQEGPTFLSHLMGPVRRSESENSEACGYDQRVYQSLWEYLPLFGFDPNPDSDLLKRNKVVFCPTLREGSLVRSAPPSVNWVGLETSSFLLIMAELMQVWWGPIQPPYWSVGTGIEVHPRDQLALALGRSKPSVIHRISEMEAFDLAIILEEQVVRAHGRNANSYRFREQLDGLPYFKKLRSSGTSIGDLQAAVALTKLRPGGLLWWAREESLGTKDGNEVLGFLLEKAKLKCEWDFSQLEHSLPGSIPLFPKHIYLFQREPHLESRHAHRPVKHTIQGQLRSHVELKLVLEEAFRAGALPLSTNQHLPPNPLAPPNRGQWKILSHSSPTPQHEWLEKWPDPANMNVIRELDDLRQASVPLANFTTIRPTPEGNPGCRQGFWTMPFPLKGFWLTAECDAEGRRIETHPLPSQGEEVQGSGFQILVPDEGWVAPLRSYLQSETIQRWLDHQAERRGERWIINEQILKWIPVPKTLLQVLGVPLAKEGERFISTRLPEEWEKMCAEIAYQPQIVQEALQNVSADLAPIVYASVFARTSNTLHHLTAAQSRLFSMVRKDGGIRWTELLNVLPKSECVSVTLHPKIRISGSLPPHLPIGRMDKVKTPSPGILLATESGFSLHISSEKSLLIQILLDELQGISNPTWAELLQYLKLPRKTELAEATALDVLRSYEEQMAHLKKLKNLLGACRLIG